MKVVALDAVGARVPFVSHPEIGWPVSGRNGRDKGLLRVDGWLSGCIAIDVCELPVRSHGIGGNQNPRPAALGAEAASGVKESVVAGAAAEDGGSLASNAQHSADLAGRGEEVGRKPFDADGVMLVDGGVDEVGGVVVIDKQAAVAGVVFGLRELNMGADDGEWGLKRTRTRFDLITAARIAARRSVSVVRQTTRCSE